MSAVEALCERAVLLSHGEIAADGPTRDVIREYLSGVEDKLLAERAGRDLAVGRELELREVTILDENGRAVDGVPVGGPMTVRLKLHAARRIERPILEIGIADGRIGPLAMASMLVDGSSFEALDGEVVVDCTFEHLPFKPRVYELWGGVTGQAGFGDVLAWQRLRLFRIEGDVTQAGLAAVSETLTKSPIQVEYRWDLRSGSNGDA
jgi:lipopolysaccharide transport system ATP-binding protein